MSEKTLGYTNYKNVQIILALLKKYEISEIVISPGNRHTPLVHSIEHDDFFNCYSIVDERSASFFAIGLIERLNRPVAICCTSGTAACNYVSAIAEAFYQQLPLVAITADRNNYYLYQQEEQMSPQQNLVKDMCKKEVTLPVVRDDKDFWYCSRLVNEALLELNHREPGPVHINYPIENNYPEENGFLNFNVKSLPDIKKIERLTLESDDTTWHKWVDKLQSSRVLIIYGQFRALTEKEKQIIDTFTKVFNCVISVDNLSNYTGNKAINTFLPSRCFSKDQIESLIPDIIITMNANSISEISNKLASYTSSYEHWHVSAKGEISDPFKCLPDIVECSPILFFEKFALLAKKEDNTSDYYDLWNSICSKIYSKNSIFSVEIEYSSLYAVSNIIKNIPENSILHLANSNSVRLASFFPVPSLVPVYCNRGTNGIDGSMSAFIGQASVSEKPSYLIIGDLSFFYDMNALWNNYVGNNVRILVCNNHGGAIFHTYPSVKNVPTLDVHIAAEHNSSVKGWAVDRGFEYISATDKTSFDNGLPCFMKEKSDKPILFEIFTDKEIDASVINEFPIFFSENKEKLRRNIAKNMPDSMKRVLKKVIK